jgi:PAS domain S-box-containing protein
MNYSQNNDPLFLHATEGILVVDDKGEIIRMNPSAEKLFGYKKDEILGKKIEVLIPHRYSESHKAERGAYNHKPRRMGADLELYALKKDGQEFPVEISLSPFKSEEGNFVIAFISDITARKDNEKQQREYSAELKKQVRNRTLILEEAIEELERTKTNLHKSLEKERELNELKSRFLSMASHEFRTPLTTMLSSLSLISRYGENKDLENQTKHVNKVKSSINNLTEILNDFLSLAKLEEGKIINVPSDFNLKTFIGDLVADMQTTIKNNQKIEYTHVGEESVFLDKKLIKNILFNLVSNAIKYSHEGGRIWVSTLMENSTVKISVKDEGIGINKEDQKHLFERFFRGHNATHIQGTGLGLSIVAKYAEVLDALIDFESKENKGTKVTITISQ